MGATIKEIAEMAGVHRSTVDKVIHNRTGVSEPVRKRVQKIIERCHYQTNPIGKALKMQEKELHIGAALLNVDAMPFIKVGIEEELKKYESFHIELDYQEISYLEIEKQIEIIRNFAKEKKDGIIISPINVKEIVQELERCTDMGIPIVTVNSDIKGSSRLCFIGQDGFKAGKIAGRLMGEFLNGIGEVAILTSDGDNLQSFPFGTREEGFRETIIESFPQMKLMPSIRTQENPVIIIQEMKDLCETKQDLAGIFITCGGVKEIGAALKQYGRKNLKVICYENYPEIMELMKEGIVTVTIDSGIKEQGSKAIEVLMDYLIYDKKPFYRHLYSDIHILVKESLE